MEGFSFQIWDGLLKFGMFIGYILLISRLPDIRRVFEYHGAEHKTIHAYEAGGDVDAATAMGKSRLHPRCGTSFLLIVFVISIVLFTLVGYQGENFFLRLGSRLLLRHRRALLQPSAACRPSASGRRSAAFWARS